MPLRPISVLLCLLCSLAGTAWAQTGDGAAEEKVAPAASAPIYAYVDGRGVWTFVDSITLVPPLFRQQALANTRLDAPWNNQRPDRPELQREVYHKGGGASPARQRTARRSPPETTTTPPPPGRRSADVDTILTRIRELQTARTAAEEQLARLEEGRPPTDDARDADLGEKDLLARIETLDAKLIGYDQEISRLQAEIGGPMDRGQP